MYSLRTRAAKAFLTTASIGAALFMSAPSAQAMPPSSWNGYAEGESTISMDDARVDAWNFAHAQGYTRCYEHRTYTVSGNPTWYYVIFYCDTSD
ncbi:MAG TPA: hypothetical protein VF557_02865 [Jatrophihabitans sp.]|uniref:hypothetical protein n=1 Tax=Jatrophihabitans sp. TaxID=1932789 RepID=UPI002EFA876F